MIGFKKKNLIALALTALMAVSGVGVYKAQAAGKIDTSIQCQVTVEVSTESTNPFAKYQKEVKVNFYKLADVNEGGQYVDGNGKVIEDSIYGVDIKKLSGKDVSAADLETAAENAYTNIHVDSANPAVTPIEKTFDLSKSATLTQDIDRGLYLFVPQKADDDNYNYTFKYSIISVPTSEAITATKVDENGNVVAVGTGNEAWTYNVKVLLKPEATPKYGSLIIKKNLVTYDKSQNTSNFTYKVTAKNDAGTIVFSNVYMFDFNAAENKEFEVKDIPAGTTVTVTEEYTGASYTADKAEVTGLEIKAGEKPPVAEFSNDYDKRLEVGGIAVENHFDGSKDATGKASYKYTGNDTTRKDTAQTQAQAQSQEGEE